MRNMLLGILCGLCLGLLVGVELTGRADAQCCSMFDVPLNTQIEMEYQQLWRDIDSAPMLTYPRYHNAPTFAENPPHLYSYPCP